MVDAAPRRTPRSLARSLLALLPALAPAALAWLALESLAAGLVRPAEALGLEYLGRLAAAVLAAAGLLAGSRRQLPALTAVTGGALAVVATAWLTPPGLPRGAAVVALLAAVLAGAAAAGLAEARGRRSRAETTGVVDGLTHFPWAGRLVVLAVGLQLLARSPLLVTPGLAETFDPELAAHLAPWLTVGLELLGWPVLGALAVSALAARRGLAAALTAGAAAVLLGGGWTREGVLCLGVLAAVPGPREMEELDDPAARRRVLGVLGAAIAIVALVALAWTRLAVFALLAALALGLADRSTAGAQIGRGVRFGGLLAVVGLAGLAMVAAVGAGIVPWSEALGRAALVPLAVPLLGLGIVRGGLGRAGLGIAALALAVVGARAVPGTAALAAPAGLAAIAAFAAFADPTRRDGKTGSEAAGAFQAAWSGLLLVAVAVAAAYPWRRADPFALLAPDSTGGRWALALAVATLGVAVAWALRSSRAGQGLDRTAAAAAVAVVVVSLGLALRLPPPGTVLLGPGGAAPRTVVAAPDGAPVAVLDRRLDPPQAVSRVVVDSFLANAADLPPGTPVATLHVELDGAPDRTWTLTTGDDTGEWAAARGDLASARLATPIPWASWVAPDSAADAADDDPTRPASFLGQLYRSQTFLGTAGDDLRGLRGPPVTSVRLTRRPDLPADTALTVRRLELF